MPGIISRLSQLKERIIRGLTDGDEAFHAEMLEVQDTLFRLRWRLLHESRALTHLKASAPVPDPNPSEEIRRQEELVQSLAASLAILDARFDKAVRLRRDLVCRQGFAREGQSAARSLSGVCADLEPAGDDGARSLSAALSEMESRAAVLSELAAVEQATRKL